MKAESPSLTFGELLAGAERVAAELAHRGIGRGDRVAIMLPTSREFFLTFAGTLLAGATPVPIYPPFRADRIAEYAERQSAILANAGRACWSLSAKPQAWPSCSSRACRRSKASPPPRR